MRASPLLAGAVGLAASLPLLVTPLRAQRNDDDATRVRHGVAIGDVPRVKGIRLNFRDRELRRVDGVNITLWAPYEDAYGGTVKGAAIGLPLTGARNIEGLAVGLLGVGADKKLEGIAVGLIGVGSGGGMRGAMVGGIGVGTGGRAQGLTVGGIGVGAGEGARGIQIGGIGVGSGGRVEGLTVGGIGVGAGGGARGIQIGGIGVGSGAELEGLSIGGIGVGGGDGVTGLSIGGVGVGSGGAITGITLAGIGIGGGGGVKGIQAAGIGIGSGGTLTGLSVAGVGVGAPRIVGFAAAAAVGGQDVTGGVIAPVFFKLENDGTFRGGAVSAVSWLKGTQRGLTIGLLNYAWRLDGVQLGLINIVRENPKGRRVLPIVNWGNLD